MPITHSEVAAVLRTAVDPLLDFLELLDVTLEHLNLLLQGLVVFTDLVDAILVLVATSDPIEAFLALLASGRDLRTCLEVLLELLQGEPVVSLLPLFDLALERAGKLQRRLLFARELQMLDHSLVIPSLLYLVLLFLLLRRRLLCSLVLTSLALRLLIFLRLIATVASIELDP